MNVNLNFTPNPLGLLEFIWILIPTMVGVLGVMYLIDYLSVRKKRHGH